MNKSSHPVRLVKLQDSDLEVTQLSYRESEGQIFIYIDLNTRKYEWIQGGLYGEESESYEAIIIMDEKDAEAYEVRLPRGYSVIFENCHKDILEFIAITSKKYDDTLLGEGLVELI